MQEQLRLQNEINAMRIRVRKGQTEIAIQSDYEAEYLILMEKLRSIEAGGFAVEEIIDEKVEVREEDCGALAREIEMLQKQFAGMESDLHKVEGVTQNAVYSKVEQRSISGMQGGRGVT